MVCHYCRAQNHAEEHRCSRCGRRLGDAPPVQRSAAAPQLEYAPVPDAPPPPAGPQLVTELPKFLPTEAPRSFQPSLFGPVEVARRGDPVPPPRKPAPRPAAGTAPRAAQQSLDFAPSVDAPAETGVYGEATVAIAAHRTVAAAIDTAVILVSIGLFFGTFAAAGHEVVLTKSTVPVYGLAAFAIALFYKLLFCIGNADTLGVQWSGLRLLNFDGRRPTRQQRVRRVVASLVSVLSTGIGFLWVLVDEERLAWHDYISKTFPSPRFRRAG